MDRYDQQSTYCRKLGHHLAFSYCRSERRGSPCRKILDCWFERIPIRDFLKKHYSQDELEEILAAPDSKLNTILSLIAQAAQKNTSEGADGPSTG